MTGPWWLGISPVQAQVACGGQQHRLRWAAGRLQALDHTDLEGEQILVALGGRCACADLTHLWARHATDIRTLVATSRGEGDPVPDPSAAALRPHRPGMSHRAADLAELLDLGGLMQDRLTATVAAAWRDRLRDGLAQRERAALHAALYGRATAALRRWTRRPDLEVELAMIGEDQPPTLTCGSDGITAELPFSWVVEVWARGLTIVWGRFCLGAMPAEAGWVLSTVSPELGPPAPVAVGGPPED
jgi:hypothetical protein